MMSQVRTKLLCAQLTLISARPTSLDDYIGQKELVGPGGMLRALVLQDTVP